MATEQSNTNQPPAAIAARTGVSTTHVSEWIAAIRRQSTRILGWNLKFTPVTSTADELEQQLRQADRTCWQAAIGDGLTTVGFVHLDLADDPQADRTFLATSELADILATLVTRIVTSERLLESTSSEFSTLADLGLSVGRQQDLQEIVRELLLAAVKLTGFRSIAFYLLNPRTDQLCLKTSYSVDPIQFVHETRHLRNHPPDLDALNGNTVHLNRGNISTELETWLPTHIRTGICLPVQTETNPFGTLWIYDRRKRQLTDRDSHVLASIAAQIAGVLERAVLVTESADQYRLRRELQVVSQFQPDETFHFVSKGSRYEANARSTARHEVGGDLCEMIELDETRTALILGDASGDSIPAALVMSAVRGAVHALTHDLLDVAVKPADVVRRLNQVLCNVTPAHQFMTLLYGVFDTQHMTFEYCNAGHPAPFFLHRGETRLLESHGMLLGVVEQTQYGSGSVALCAGDLLVGFSDGISEAMSAQHQMFRSEGIAGVIRQFSDCTAREVVDAIWSTMEQHTAGSGDGDDRTVVAVKMLDRRAP